MKIIVDSSCDSTAELLASASLELHYIPFSLLLDDEHIMDDESFEIGAYIDKMRKAASVKTAAPSPDLYLNEMRHDGDSFVICISSPLSASYANAMIAKDMYEEEGGKNKVHVFDSRSASAGPILIALKINEMKKVGASFEDIVKEVQAYVDTMKTYFVLERYDNLVKNGRISATVAKVASMLNVRPVCAEVEGKLAMVDKAMGANKAMAKIVKRISDDKNVDFSERTLAIGNVRCYEKAVAFRDEILKQVKFKDTVIVSSRGLCTTYADDGGVIISY
jgi:DegV family protein with EDD domain